MKRGIFVYIIALILVSGPVFAGRITISFDFLNTSIEMPDSAGSAVLTKKQDPYTRQLTAFDIEARLHGRGTEADYLRFASQQTRTWTDAEQNQLERIFAEIEDYLIVNRIKIKLPPSITIVKTTGLEEMGSDGYTRENRIMLNPGEKGLNITTVALELFHIISRYNEEKRDQIYQLFGFRKCNEIRVRGVLEENFLTNPDCPNLNHYLHLHMDDKDRDMVLVVYSNQSYKDQAVITDLISTGLLEIGGDSTRKLPVIRKDGTSEIRRFEEVPDIYNKVGLNTPYVLHPEEIAAEHFALLVSNAKVKQPVYLYRMRDILKSGPIISYSE